MSCIFSLNVASTDQLVLPDPEVDGTILANTGTIIIIIVTIVKRNNIVIILFIWYIIMCKYSVRQSGPESLLIELCHFRFG